MNVNAFDWLWSMLPMLMGGALIFWVFNLQGRIEHLELRLEEMETLLEEKEGRE